MHNGIAFVGAQGSGKTKMAGLMAVATGGTRLSFAAALRDEVAMALAIGPEDAMRMAQAMQARNGKEVFRPLLQAWGMVRRELFDEDYWVRYLLAQVERPPGPYFIDDCRFPNEYAALMDAGFTFYGLEANPDIEPQHTDHESEAHWAGFEVHHVLPFALTPEVRVQRVLGEWKTNA